MTTRIKIAIVFTVCLVLLISLSIPFYLNLHTESLRAEARIMLGYIGTLQAAHFGDSGTYVAFDELYGAQLNGKENCRRPRGAEDLGFTLRGCDRDPNAGGLRYAYRVRPSVNPASGAPDLKYGYVAEAMSGSDITGESLICLGSAAKDLWNMGADRIVEHVNDCE